MLPHTTATCAPRVRENVFVFQLMVLSRQAFMNQSRRQRPAYLIPLQPALQGSEQMFCVSIGGAGTTESGTIVNEIHHLIFVARPIYSCYILHPTN